VCQQGRSTGLPPAAIAPSGKAADVRFIEPGARRRRLVMVVVV